MTLQSFLLFITSFDFYSLRSLEDSDIVLTSDL